MRRLILLFSLPIYAQLQEDFSDGDFTNNPAWTGTTSYWTVTPDKRLRSNGPAAPSRIYLATANTLIHNTEWRFWVRVGFNPSTSNFVRIYLVADRADPTDPNLQGYYLRLGGITGSSDSLELWHQQGNTHTRLAGGIRGRFGGTNNILRIRVLRSASGTWQVYSDSTGFWEEEFTTTHTALSNTAYFIVFFEHTSTNRQNLWLDDFYIGPIQPDNAPPSLRGAEFETPTRLLLTFSEALSPPSAGQPSNYNLSSPTGSIGIQQAVLTSPRTVALSLMGAVTPSVLCTLRYEGIQDLAGNVGSGDTVVVLPEEPQAGEVIFSELMVKPTPAVGLPAAEYVEIHNRSARWVRLGNVQFCEGNRCISLENRILSPRSYAILVAAANATAYPGALIVPSYALNDDGDSLTLLHENGYILDRVRYTNQWYRNPSKARGGWSLERIDLDNLCAQDSNWIASIAPAGGTPGQPNSVAGLWRDRLPPALLYFSIPAPQRVHLFFSEPVDTAAMRDPTRYTLSGGISVTAALLWDESSVELQLSVPLSPTTEYTLQVRARDCVGNEGVLSHTLAIPSPAQPYDVICTEIMADPDPPVRLPPYEYVEIYNRSPRYLDLGGWKLRVGNTERTLPRYLLRPGEYVILTSAEGALALAPWGRSLGVLGFPTLPNAGATLMLKDTSGRVIERIMYSSQWYGDASKEEGGWSLERKWTEWLCGDAENWAATQSPQGGTPGSPNSLRSTASPPPPIIQSLTYTPPFILLRFSERMDTLLLQQVERYQWQPEIPLIAAISRRDGLEVELLPMTPLQENSTYHLRLVGMQTCAGQRVDTLRGSLIVPSVPQPGDVVINEILPEPQTGGKRYVELYNRSERVIDLRQLMIARGMRPRSIQRIADQSALLMPGAYVCLSSDTNDVKNRYAPPAHARFHQMRDFPAYDYERDTVWLLRQGDSVVIDRVPYASSYHFADLRNPKGVALERLSPHLPSDRKENWFSAASAVRYGTPGYENSQRITEPDAKSPIRLEPRTFSPDGDGYDDLLWIYIQADEAGVKAEVSIHTLTGHKVKQLTEGDLLSVGENSFRWDGTDSQGKRLPAGVYMVHVLLSEPHEGEVRQYRLLCAVAERVK